MDKKNILALYFIKDKLYYMFQMWLKGIDGFVTDGSSMT